jgi:hypothetical protein
VKAVATFPLLQVVPPQAYSGYRNTPLSATGVGNSENSGIPKANGLTESLEGKEKRKKKKKKKKMNVGFFTVDVSMFILCCSDEWGELITTLNGMFCV